MQKEIDLVKDELARVEREHEDVRLETSTSTNSHTKCKFEGDP